MADNFTERENFILGNSVNIEWFLKAIDKNNPLHPEEGAAHTESYELDGQNILVPRVRIKDGKAVLNADNALDEALEKGDYIVVPQGEDPDQYSKDLSKLIGKFRGFNKGGDVSAQMNSMLPKKGMSYGELILDNILGLDNEYESFGEKLGKAINEDEVGFLKDASVGAYEGAKELITSPRQTTKKVFSEIKDGVQRLGSENLSTRLNNMYGVSYVDATDDQVNSAKEAVFGDAITALSLVPAAKATVSVAKAGIKNTNIDKVMTLGETEGSTFKGKLNLVHGFNPPTDAPNLVPTFTASEKYGGERYGELDGAETPGGSYGATGVYLENPSDPLFFNSPEMQGFYAPKTAQVSAQFNKAFILRPDTLKELEQITGINLKDSLPKIEDGNLKEKNYLAEEQGALVSAKLKELGYDGLIVKDFFLGDKEIDVYDKYEPLRKKIEVKYKEKFGKPIPEKGTKEHQQIINLYNKQNKELEKIYNQAGIHPLLTQPQIIHLKPETLSTEKVFPESLQSNPSQVSDLQGTQPIQGEKTPGYLERALNKLPEYDPNTLGIMGGNINLTPKAANSPDEPKIISFTKKKEDKELENFNTNLMSSISEQASKQAKLVEELQEAGVYGDYQKGVRVQSQNYKGEALPPYRITGLSLNKVKLNNPNLKRTEDRLGIKFEYIEKDGDYYLPMLSVEQADGGKSQVYLDALKQRNTPIMDGPKDFNKGGIAMNEQMEMAFMQEGGLKDDGMNQDPVSGNEVPSGSMAKEVRDDISANLSEGEYVVPADVVRFFGVKFFEDLRMQAKMGLQTMEANGRIGGEPVDSLPEEEVLSDKDFAMLLQQELGGTLLAEGGMVSGESQSYSAEEPRQFNTGGYSTTGFDGDGTGRPLSDAPEQPYVPGSIPSFDPSNYGLGFSMTPGYTRPPAPPASPTTETDKSCEARGMILGPNGICIPKPEPKRGGDGSGGTPPPPPEEGGSINLGGDNWFKDDSELLFSDPSTYIKNQLANRGGRFDSGIAKAGALALPGGLGLILAGGDTVDDTIGIAKARAALMVAEASGAIGEKEAKELRQLIAQDAQGNFFVDQDGKGLGIGTGVNWANSLSQSLGFKDLEDLQSNKSLAAKTWKAQTKPAADKPAAGKVDPSRTFRKSDKDTRSETVALRERVKDDRESFAEKIQKEAKAIADKAANTGKSIAEVGKEKAPSSEAKTEAEKAAAEGDPRAGMYNKGGLMKKKPKKK